MKSRNQKSLIKNNSVNEFDRQRAEATKAALENEDAIIQAMKSIFENAEYKPEQGTRYVSSRDQVEFKIGNFEMRLYMFWSGLTYNTIIPECKNVSYESTEDMALECRLGAKGKYKALDLFEELDVLAQCAAQNAKFPNFWVYGKPAHEPESRRAGLGIFNFMYATVCMA